MPKVSQGHSSAYNNNGFSGGVAKSDYACNGADGWSWSETLSTYEDGINYAYTGTQNGMFFPKSCVTVGEIRDGTTNTYFCGEKYLIPDKYEASGTTGTAQGDDWNCWMGPESNDLARYSSYQPMQDRPGYDTGFQFGSAHAGSFGMAMCDGSAQRISCSIDAETHLNLGKKADGKVANLP